MWERSKRPLHGLFDEKEQLWCQNRIDGFTIGLLTEMPCEKINESFLSSDFTSLVKRAYLVYLWKIYQRNVLSKLGAL